MRTVFHKLKIAKAALMVAVSALLFSCSSFLEPSQDLIQDRDDHYQNLDQVRRGVIGAYAGLQDLVEELVVLGDLRADLMTTTRNYDAFLEEIELHNVSADNPYIDARPYYDIILNCNDILDNMAKAKADPQMTELQYNGLEAEVKTLRAWVYLQLARTYRKVPVVKESLNGTFGDYDPPVYGMVDMVNWLIQEMNEAIEQPVPDWRVFQKEKDKDPKEVSQPWRLTRISRKALLGELYLESGNYMRASELFYDAIISGGTGKDDLTLKCSEASGSDWRKFWEVVSIGDHVSKVEHLTAIPFSRSQHQRNGLMSLFSNNPVHSYVLKPTELAVQAWESQPRDGSSGVLFTGDFTRGLNKSYARIGIDTLVYKYMLGKSPTRNQNDAVYCIYRAADLHLLYAEAINLAGDSDKALDVINEKLDGSPKTAGVRGRVGLKGVNLQNIQDRYPEMSARKDLVEMAILEERALEFAYEGRRWNDLVRFATRSNRLTWFAETVARKFKETDPEKYKSVKNLLKDKDNWRYEMPRKTLDL
ncbi:hypothetical protein FUAX_30040 [Fulvitalea axinellae]|uniref:RagB/SusD domain-containing protein n=1 Tax=Fulvitalea axinellae TaxID=1182444 RepID=A0AAU9CRF9_9BACT|nr:hypothetical protein FUAX_30040 [Fulvitalea axinellae]